MLYLRLFCYVCSYEIIAHILDLLYCALNLNKKSSLTNTNACLTNEGDNLFKRHVGPGIIFPVQASLTEPMKVLKHE